MGVAGGSDGWQVENPAGGGGQLEIRVGRVGGRGLLVLLLWRRLVRPKGDGGGGEALSLKAF